MIVKLGDIARESKCTTGNKDCPIVGLEHLEPKELLLKNYSSDSNTTFTKSFKAGQILFGRRRSYQQKASVATFDGICSGDIIVIEAIPEKVEPRLLPFIIQNEAFFNYSIIGSAGGLSPRVKWQHLANYEFDLPSLEEQRVLADKLWAAYEVKESYKNLLAQTDKLLHAQFEKMFGEETGNNKRIIGDIGEVITGNTPSTKEPRNYESNDVCFYKPSDFEDSSLTKLSDSEYHISRYAYEHSRKLPKDSVLTTCIGIIGKVGILKHDATCNQQINAIIPNKSVIHPVYLGHVLLYSQSLLNDTANTNIVPLLNKTDFSAIEILIPPMKKQLEFVSIAEQAEQTKASLNKGIEAIEAVIRSLIAEGTTKV